MIGPIGFEALDARAELEAFEIEEVVIRRQLSRPRWLREGLDSGRLRMSKHRARLVLRRLVVVRFDQSPKLVSFDCPRAHPGR